MKKIALLSLLFSSFTANASFVGCYEQVSEDYYGSSFQARFSEVKFEPDYIGAGFIKYYGRNVAFGPYDEDKLAFHATGSRHSGWFHNVIIADRITCEIEEIREAAAE